MRIKRAAKYGFCAGVRIADGKVKKFAADGNRGAILGQVVHNERVVEEMAHLGVPTVESLQDVRGGTIVFSAHGVPDSFHHEARRRGLNILDTTCPFVYDIHAESREALAQGYHLVFIGDPNHREVMGYTRDLDPQSYHVLSTVEEACQENWAKFPKVKILYQTTLNSEEYADVARYIEEQTREAVRADTICYATKENQDAAKELAEDPEVDLILVVGGRKSANTRHLWELCRRYKPSHLIHDAEGLDPTWLEDAETVGITAGASTPDYLIEEVEAEIRRLAEVATT